MQTNVLSTIARLSDRHLLDETKRLASRERDVTAELIAHLAEIEERGLHRAAGFGSMFEYCREVLRLSEHAAYGRIEAARAARRFPVILERSSRRLRPTGTKSSSPSRRQRAISCVSRRTSCDT